MTTQRINQLRLIAFLLAISLLSVPALAITPIPSGWITVSGGDPNLITGITVSGSPLNVTTNFSVAWFNASGGSVTPTTTAGSSPFVNNLNMGTGFSNGFSYFTVTNIDGQTLYSDQNGSLPDILILETGGNDAGTLQAILPDNSLGQALSFTATSTTWGGVLRAAGSGSWPLNQAVKGFAINLSELKNASGQAVTQIKGIRVNASGLDPVVVAFGAAGSSSGTTYYVKPASQGGSNSNNGLSPSTAWATIIYAASSASPVAAGDTVVVLPGTYNGHVIVQKSGNASAGYVTFKAQNSDGGPNENVIVNGGRFYIHAKSYIRIQGFRIQNSNYGIDCEAYNGAGVGAASSHISIVNCHTFHTSEPGIKVWGDRSDSELCAGPAMTNVLITGNIVEDAVYEGANECISVGQGTVGFEISYNEVIGGGNESGGESIDVKHGAFNGSIHHNIVRDKEGKIAIYVDGGKWSAGNIDIHSNIVRNVDADAIKILAEGWSGQGDVNNVNVYNNLLYKNTGGGVIVIDRAPTDRPYRPVNNIKIYNNTIFDNAGPGFSLNNPLADNVTFVNNISYKNGWQDANDYEDLQHGTNYVQGDNLFGNPFGPPSQNPPGNIIGNPQFVNELTLDLHLQSTSLAIDAGRSTPAPGVDFDGADRPAGSGIDIGAYEFGSVMGMFVFYNNSAWDGNSTAANSSDDAAIATDKTALRPGQTATFANYTSYSKGINGVMIDIQGMVGAPTASDFEFKVGNSNTPSSWAAAPAPQSISVRPRAGKHGSDRVTITWADSAIRKQWLQVRVKATPITRLSKPCVFYFGNAVGESGDTPANAVVNATDEVRARNNPAFLPPATINNVLDFDRNRAVDAADQVLVRNNVTFLDALKLISVPAE